MDIVLEGIVLMVLQPGDKVTETCTQVGNFPFGLLKNPDALALDAGSLLTGTPALANKKQDYIDNFESKDLIVCEENYPFAKLGQPLRLGLKIEDEEQPPTPPTEADTKWVFQIVFRAQGFSESELWLAANCGNCLFKAIGQTFPPYNDQMFYWYSDIGSISFGAKTHPYMLNVSDDDALCPKGGVFGCDVHCYPALDGTIDLISYWDADTMNPVYLNENNINPSSVKVADLVITMNGPEGVVQVVKELYASGTSSYILQCAYPSWTCYDSGAPWGFETTFQSGSAYIGFGTAYIIERWKVNSTLIYAPNRLRLPPGIAAWPPIIDDPNDPY